MTKAQRIAMLQTQLRQRRAQANQAWAYARRTGHDGDWGEAQMLEQECEDLMDELNGVDEHEED